MINQDPKGKLWCSTKVEGPENEHVKGKGFWGFCDMHFGKCITQIDVKSTTLLKASIDAGQSSSDVKHFPQSKYY